MPTGYTANLTETTSLRDFTLLCARAFGALVTMRDDPMDAPIPDEFNPSPYYEKALEKARDEYARLQGLTLDQALAEAKADVERRLQQRYDAGIKSEKLRAVYKRMLALVQAWTPPTAEHDELKNFMIEQLSESTKFDCLDEATLDRVYSCAPVDAAAWLQARKDTVYEEISRHASEFEKEKARCASRTAWVKALRGSLSLP